MSTPAFDLIGKRYNESFSDRGAQLAEGEWLIGELPAGARVLDLGCGSGVPTARQLSEAGLEVLGVDESGVMLDLARTDAPKARYLQADLRALPPGLGRFGAAVSYFSLLMLSRAEIEEVLRDVRRRMETGGLLGLGMVLGDMDGVATSFLGAPVRISAYPPDRLSSVVTEAGFTVLGITEVVTVIEPERSETQLYLRARADRRPSAHPGEP
jgi:SAM-dependent methyltransferase